MTQSPSTSVISSGWQQRYADALPEKTMKIEQPLPEFHGRQHPLIGLCGSPGSGKDTVAKILAPLGWTRVSFADPLRSMLLALNPMTTVGIRVKELVELIGWEAAKKVGDVRELLQRLGTEAVRECLGEDAWVDLARKKIASINGPVVITDVRFPNEVGFVRELAGEIILVNRPGVGAVNNHSSENRDFEVDWTLENGPDLAKFIADVKMISERSFCETKFLNKCK